MRDQRAPGPLWLAARKEIDRDAMSRDVELLTTMEMAEADRLAVVQGVASLDLMENAGRAVADAAAAMAPFSGRIVIVCGPGNNGGDGYVAARLLDEAGFDVDVVLLGTRRALRGDSHAMASRWGEAEHPLDALPALLANCDVVVDALFGAGLSRPLAGAAETCVVAMNACGKPILAVDVPSGLDGSTGAPTGPVVRATRTVTFFRLKPAHVLFPGRALCGDVRLVDIGLPTSVLEHLAVRTWRNAPALWLDRYPRLKQDGHKYARGHAVVVSGGIEMSGAARLCARGVLRAGAGLTTIASPPDALLAHAAQLNAILLKAGQEPHDLARLLADQRYNAVAIGPGLGLQAGALDRVMAVLTSGAAVVLDADAITVAAPSPADLFGAIAANAARPVVLTPHEGEFKRLFPSLTGCKLERARAAAALSGAVVLLKGPDTVIAAPDGRAAINDNAPPWLATAGSGDVLAGFVTGLLAQGMAAWDATCAAVWLHGECATAFGRGLIAEDLPETLPGVLRTMSAD
jgi:ADP-dependent NAD(P)H-hydrate dehydratase / NAD(P)H-hydrate epimerase